MNKLQKSISPLLLFVCALPLLGASKETKEEQLLEEIQNLEQQLSSKREELKILRSNKQPLEIRILHNGTIHIHEKVFTLDDLRNKTDWSHFYRGRADIIATADTSQELIKEIMKIIYSNGWKNLHINMNGRNDS